MTRGIRNWRVLSLRTTTVLAITTVMALMARQSQAVIIGFENFAPPGDLVNVSPTSPYTEAGFTFTPTNGESAIFDSASTVGMSGNGTDFFGFAEDNPITLTMTASGGGPFNIAGLEIGRTNIATAPNVTFTITGFPVGGGTNVATFPGISTFTPVNLNWTNLNRIVISATDDAGFDNVNVSVPEPSGLVPLAMVAGWATRWRRRA
jgi:hypothetical protein